jgi:hypothetical protein
MQRTSLSCGAAIIAAATVAGSATAAVAPAFSRSQARVGSLVSVLQPGGLTWLHSGSRPIRIYLVRASVVSRVIGTGGTVKKGPPPVGVARYIGTWSRTGRLTFRVPPIRAGRYAAVAWCLPCGGTLVGSVPWSVRDGVELHADGSLLTIRA